MRIVWRYLFGHRWLIALTLALASAGQVMALVDPIIFGKIVDEYVEHPGARGLYYAMWRQQIGERERPRSAGIELSSA